MIQYKFYQKNPSSHYVYIDMHVDNINEDTLLLQLPAWRPGRYELGNFAKNIKKVDIYNQAGETVSYRKLNKDLWEADTRNVRSVKVTYSYYAAELNAGACYADPTQLYINPVHCCMYVPGRMDEEHVIELKTPSHFKLATSLKISEGRLIADNYDELADSPFISSENIKTDNYHSNGISFYIHFNGICRPDFDKIKKDFQAFTDHCIKFWGDFPYDTYHFLIQVLPAKFYHGVEHKKNTVIAIGPGYSLNSGSTYEELLGVSCHELFHVWNVKTIRPVEMQPYDFTKENYARTGYVYEGFTTYYGDKLLLGSGVFTLDQYFVTLQERILKHFHNYGRFNLAVAQSSWETWLDGYVPGAPYRKTNIYDEGNLVAFMLDVNILKATGNKKSLHDVCVLLYERYGKPGKGYYEKTIIEICNEVSGQEMNKFFETFVYSPSDFEMPLTECFDYLGFEFHKIPSSYACEQHYGFKVTEAAGTCKISLVAPYSPAWKAGLFAGDEIIAVNGTLVRTNFNSWLQYFLNDEEVELTVGSNEKLKNLKLQKDKKGNYFFNPVLRLAGGNFSDNYRSWILY
jgi:predicted metalloprotease with PDZ domain